MPQKENIYIFIVNICKIISIPAAIGREARYGQDRLPVHARADI